MEVVPDMPLDRLDSRGKELSASLRSIEHCPERKQQIQHELSVIAFELYCQYNEGKVEVVEL